MITDKNLKILLENSQNEKNNFKEYLTEAPTSFEGSTYAYHDLFEPVIKLTYQHSFLKEIVSVQSLRTPKSVVYGAATKQVVAGAEKYVDGYRIDLDANTNFSYPSNQSDPIKEINVGLIGTPVDAKTRKLKINLTREMLEDAKSYIDFDFAEEGIKFIASALNFEIENEVLSYLKTHAHYQKSHTVSISAGEDLTNIAIRFQNDLTSVLSAVGSRTGVGFGNFVVVPRKFVKLFYVMEDFEGYETEYYSFMQPVGLLNKKIKVFVNPLDSTNSILVGYKSRNMNFGSGCIYAPYSYNVYPTTDATTLNQQQAVFARYGLTILHEGTPLTGGSAVNNIGSYYYGLMNVTIDPSATAYMADPV